jgi:hypothetical protein
MCFFAEDSMVGSSNPFRAIPLIQSRVDSSSSNRDSGPVSILDNQSYG